VLSPVILILTGAVVQMFLISGSKAVKFLLFLSDPSVALFIALFIGIYLLGIRQKRKMADIMKSLSESASGVTMILLIIASGGAFKQVLTDSGSSEYIKIITYGLHINPLILT
jgi:H+/gluconate symporter-like permease